MPWGRVLGAALDAVGGVVWGAVGVGAGGCGGAVGGVVWGAVGVGAGSCYEAHRASHLGRLEGRCGVSWGWVLGAAMRLTELPTWGLRQNPHWGYY